MNESEINNTEVNPSEQFFSNENIGTEKRVPDKKETKEENSFISKGSNKVLNKPYNIHFTIGGKMFANMLQFINLIDYKSIFQFKQKEVNIMAVDAGNTHMSLIKFEKTEFADYLIKDLEGEDSEKLIYIDLSITEDLPVDDNHPIDFYVDTIVMNRFYMISGKVIVYKQLGVLNTSESESVIVGKAKFLTETIAKIHKTNFQRISISQIALSNLMKSLSKQKSKKKDETVNCKMELKKNNILFTIQNESSGIDIELSGDDIMVYPTDEDMSIFDIEYFNKFGILKSSYTTTMYTKSPLPIIFESRLGGGKIIVYYLLATRSE